MAKAEQRGNCEAKKRKKQKPKTIAASPRKGNDVYTRRIQEIAPG